MSTELRSRYQEEWDALLKNNPFKDVAVEQPTNPLLLEVPPSYVAADYRVMVFGQETNDWEGVFPHEEGVGHLLEVYEGFYTEGRGRRPFQNGIRKCGGPGCSDSFLRLLSGSPCFLFGRR